MGGGGPGAAAGPTDGLGSMRKPSANRSAAGGRGRRRAGAQGPRPGKSSPTSPRPNKTRAGARAPQGPGGGVNNRGRGLGRRGEGMGGAERPGKADKRHHLRGPERPAPSSRGAASAPRASGLHQAPPGSSGPAPTPRALVPSCVTSALPPSWRPRPARPLGAAPAAARRLRRRCPPGPAAELCRPAPLPAAPSARPRAGPAPAPAAPPARGSGGSARSLPGRARGAARGCCGAEHVRAGSVRPRSSPGAGLGAPGGLGGAVSVSSEGRSFHSVPFLYCLVQYLVLSGVLSALAIRLPLKGLALPASQFSDSARTNYPSLRTVEGLKNHIAENSVPHIRSY